MIDLSLIKIVPARESHRVFSYTAKKAAEGNYISQIWGWNEKVQRDFHARQWKEERPSIILYNNHSIGTIHVSKNDDCMKIGQFFILPEYQKKGIGSFILRDILEKADRDGRIIRLTYLNNNPVASLYARLGFKVIGTRDEFILVERQPLPVNEDNL